MQCNHCDHEHDGTYMRTNTRYTRVKTMLVEECPHDDQGRIELCHVCQRSVYFAGGYIRMLADITYRMARTLRDKQRVEAKRARIAQARGAA